MLVAKLNVFLLFSFLSRVGSYRLLARGQVYSALAALFGWQGIARTTQKNASRGCPNLHITAALRTLNISIRGPVGAHTTLFGFCFRKLTGETLIEIIQQRFPVFLTRSHVIERVFHLRCKIVIHQLIETFDQPFGHDIAHLQGVESLVLYPHITSILNGRDNRCIGRRTADISLLQLLNQTCFGKTCGWLGKVLERIKLF